jgi:hypothetical protein
MTAYLAPRSAPRLGLVVLVAALTSCEAFRPALSLPEQGPTGWSQLTTAHFVLSTDLSPELAQQRIQRFETLRSVLEDVAFPPAEEAPRPLTVVVFRRDRDYQALAPFGTVGVFFADPSGEDQPMILASAELAQESGSRDTMPPLYDRCGSRASMSANCWSPPRSESVTPEEAEQRFVHEMVHALMDRSFGDAPPWLDEGLAQYLSTVRLEDDRVVLGDPVPAATAVPSSLLPSVQDLMRADPDRFHPREADSETAGRYYAGAWVLVHLFENGPDVYRKRFGVLASALQDGKTADDAWQAAMAGLNEATVQADYMAHARTPAGQRVERPPTTRPGSAVQVHAMSADEVRSLWADARHRLEGSSP